MMRASGDDACSASWIKVENEEAKGKMKCENETRVLPEQREDGSDCGFERGPGWARWYTYTGVSVDSSLAPL